MNSKKQTKLATFCSPFLCDVAKIKLIQTFRCVSINFCSTVGTEIPLSTATKKLLVKATILKQRKMKLLVTKRDVQFEQVLFNCSNLSATIPDLKTYVTKKHAASRVKITKRVKIVRKIFLVLTL